MRTTLVVVVSVMFSVGMAGMAVAGSIDSPGAPSAGSGMYSLTQVYDYLNSGIEVTPVPSFQEPSSAPGSTMKTLKDIYDDLRAKYIQCTVTADKVKSGEKFFCTQPGRWGVQTGTAYIPPTPTPTSIPTPTPTKTFYEQYGPPPGEDKVVHIGSMYVAKWTDNEGTAMNDGKIWTVACSWGTDLVWLGKDDWRLPTKDELISICTNRGSLGAYHDVVRYWSSTAYDESFAWSTWFSVADGCATDHDADKPSGRFIRAVRNAD
ncbi:MAG: hypothetical protein NTZ78_09365 [Candidatus Aureabacteria bacterium]|nr:hypothetical protein [Candidatus Auribacterota bacterium]